ncbi:hypothetical protein CU003_1861 [Enterococcus faecium]|nr:hypothetical protein [Enterococcus faecium]MBK4809736.1 hypothetical protein [Enterococcus faecium]MBK4843061.1 hypothetical protein [Enterococcus faecium]MBK4856740.1 hypothetical protein [Enterococcus faecium]MBK4868731.1 hypothetical protein [Enterococcus faecium]
MVWLRYAALYLLDVMAAVQPQATVVQQKAVQQMEEAYLT